MQQGLHVGSIMLRLLSINIRPLNVQSVQQERTLTYTLMSDQRIQNETSNKEGEHTETSTPDRNSKYWEETLH